MFRIVLAVSFPSNRKGASVRQMLGRPGEAWARNRGPIGWSWCEIEKVERSTRAKCIRE
jgi:hypothetical protein